MDAQLDEARLTLAEGLVEPVRADIGQLLLAHWDRFRLYPNLCRYSIGCFSILKMFLVEFYIPKQVAWSSIFLVVIYSWIVGLLELVVIDNKYKILLLLFIGLASQVGRHC